MAIIEPKLKELEGPSRLALGFFNSLIRRIECTKPIAGNGITCTQVLDGIEISFGSGGDNAVTINVCSNGAPYKLVLFYDPERTKKANS